MLMVGFKSLSILICFDVCKVCLCNGRSLQNSELHVNLESLKRPNFKESGMWGFSPNTISYGETPVQANCAGMQILGLVHTIGLRPDPQNSEKCT